MAQILCSTGALIGHPNNRDYRLLQWLAEKLHCDGFEFMMYETWYEQAEDIVAFLLNLKLNIPVMHCEKHIGEAISRGEEGDLEEAYRRFTINCDMAKRLGAKKMVIHLWDGLTSDKNIENNIVAYGELEKIATEYGITILVENVVCNRQDPMTHWCELLQAYPHMQFVFDTKMAAFHEQLELLYKEDYEWLCENCIKHYHINDYAGGYKDWANLKTLPIGRGNIDFDEFFGFVHKMGYDGTFTVEATAFNKEGVVDVDMLNRCFETIREYMKKDKIVLKKPTIAY